MFYSLLTEINLLEQGYRVGLDFLGKFAKAIIEGVGAIGLGIILFTIVLKAMTLPFDIYQRVTQRKQNLIMKEMQPELEKLQKQYANDKTMYNKKMMELYKKNGYSMLGACLPMIISLVILIVAFQGFRNYSQYANLAMYEKMSVAYNERIMEHGPEMLSIELIGEEESADALLGVWDSKKKQTVYKLKFDDHTASPVTLTSKWTAEKKKDPVQVDFTVPARLTFSYAEPDSEGQRAKLITVEAASSENGYFMSYTYTYSAENKYLSRKFYFNDARLQAYIDAPEAEDGRKEKFEAIVAESSAQAGYTDEVAYKKFIKKMGAESAAAWYRDGHSAKFLWVKNVWYPDVSYNHPIQAYKNLKSQVSKKVIHNGTKKPLSTVLQESDYEDLTSELIRERKQPNGYFILIILSIGLMVLSQWISMRSSKESNKYQTVDGQGAKTQKIMMIVMPLIYAVFAFMYSAAFSIYMTMSSVFALAVTLLCNLFLGIAYKKREAAVTEERHARRYDWQLTDKERKKREKDAKKREKKDKKGKK